MGAGAPKLSDAWFEFFHTRPKGYCFEERDPTDSVGRDEWTQIYLWFQKLNTDFKDYDEYNGPSLISEWKAWMESKWGSMDDGDASGDDDDCW